MSWLFSRVLVEAYSEVNCSDGEPSVQSNGNPTQLAYLPPDKMTAFSRLSRFGMTFKPLTADRGEALLTLYRAAFPVKTFPQPDAEQALTASDQECGERWHGWLAKFDPSTSLLKTPQCLLFAEGCESLKTLPRSGMTVNGMLWERQTLVRRISATESGLWLPTPTVGMVTGGQNPENGGQIGLGYMARKNAWPTPTVCGNYNRKGASASSGDGLATAVQMWPTPTAALSNSGGSNCLGKRQPENLASAVKSWPTPIASDSRGSSGRAVPGKQVQLVDAVRTFPTSTRRDYRSGTGAQDRPGHSPPLTDVIGGTLNPTWVEWLMGWPLEWTDLKPLEMGKFQQWQQQHLHYSLQGETDD